MQEMISFDNIFLISIMIRIVKLLFLILFNVALSQEIKWGVISSEEISLTEVPFETGADAVKLQEIGDLTMTDHGYELLEYGRSKILSLNGFDIADKKWSYRSNDSRDKVVVLGAQTINIIEGKQIITPVEKKDIIVSVSNGVEEIAFAFPNVQVGSIIEYKVKITRPYDLYSSPWYFQDTIPTLSSKLKFKLETLSNYKIILKGQLLNKKYKGKNIKKWELNNIPSENIYKNVYNKGDYRDRIMLQFSSAYDYYGSYYSENSWKGFKNLILKDIDKSIQYADFQAIGDRIKNGSSKLETLQNCIVYLQNYYEWNEYFAIQTTNLQADFLHKKKGNSADFNILLKEILRTKNINSELAINSLRSSGRIIIAYPAFSKLQTLVNIVELDNNEKVMVDAATSKVESIKYLSLDYFNHIVLGLNDKKESFTLVAPNLSEYISVQKLNIHNDNSRVEVQNRSKGYFDIDDFESSVFDIFSGVKTNEKIENNFNEWRISNKNIEFDHPANSLFLIENPFTKILKDLMVEKDRSYPIELEFPFLVTIQLKTELPENYKLETEMFDDRLTAFDGSLQYVQERETIGKDEVITYSLLINKCIYQPNEISEYQEFINQLGKVISDKVGVIKKR